MICMAPDCWLDVAYAIQIHHHTDPLLGPHSARVCAIHAIDVVKEALNESEDDHPWSGITIMRDSQAE